MERLRVFQNDCCDDSAMFTERKQLISTLYCFENISTEFGGFKQKIAEFSL